MNSAIETPRGRKPTGEPVAAATPRSRSSSSDTATRSRHGPTNTALLKRRILSVAAYAEELRHGALSQSQKLHRFGSTTAPIPVALRPGERVEEYAARFRTWLSARHTTWESLKRSANQERSLRIAFARENVEAYERGYLTRAAETKRDSAKDSPDPLCELTFVDLETHQHNVRTGKFRNTANMTRTQKIEAFGSHVVPIFVPLAPGETPAMYEARFVEWLGHVRKTTLEAIRRQGDENQERFERIQFSTANAQGVERLSAPTLPDTKRKRSDELSLERMDEQPLSKRPARGIREPVSPHTSGDSHQEETDAAVVIPPSPLPVRVCKGVSVPPDGASVAAIVGAYVNCGCHQCLLHGLLHVAQRVSEQETMTRSPLPLVDLTRGGDATVNVHSHRSAAAITKIVLADDASASTQLTTASVIVSPGKFSDDLVERQLVNEYDAINNRLLATERELEEEAHAIMSATATDIMAAMQLQDAHLQRESMIEKENDQRTNAFAKTVVYMWRHSQRELAQLLADARDTDVVHLQLASHQKCAALSSHIHEHRDRITSLKTQLDTILASDYDSTSEANRLAILAHVGALLTTTESDLAQLVTQRRREFATLVRFDARTRALVQALLTRAMA